MLYFFLGVAAVLCVVVKNYDAINKYLHHIVSETPEVYYQDTKANQQLVSNCKSLSQDKFCPALTLPNGHFQTLKGSALTASKTPKVDYQRELIVLADGGMIGLDWAFPADTPMAEKLSERINPQTPTMLVVAGMGGSSRDYYVRCLVDRMISNGWQVVVMNFRGCGRVPLKTPKISLATTTEDVRSTVDYLIQTYGKFETSFVAAGFSLGSTLLVNYIAEEKAFCVFTGAVAIDNPFNLSACTKKLESSWFQRKVYNMALTKNLQHLVLKKMRMQDLFPNVFNAVQLKKVKDLRAFDEVFTSKIGGFQNGEEYYQKGSCTQRMAQIQVPLLCVNALDDPISTKESIPYEQVHKNPHIILCTTKRGGHLAHFECPAGPKEQYPQNWSTKVAFEFAESLRLSKKNHLDISKSSL